MKTLAEKKLEDAIANAEKYIEQMRKMDDRNLSKRIDLFQEQMLMAYKKGDHTTYSLLAEYERQTLAARMRKNFPNDIE